MTDASDQELERRPYKYRGFRGRRYWTSGALLGFFLALGLIFSSLIIASTARDVAPARDKVLVKGYAEKKVVSDMGVWTGRFSSRSTNLQTAYNDILIARGKVQEFLKEQGITADVQFTPIETMTIYRHDPQVGMTNDIQAYELAQSVSVTSKNVELISKLSGSVSELIKQDVTLASMPPQFYYTGLEALKLDLLGEATQNAQERAAVLAQSGGAKVGKLLSAQQGVFQITPPLSTEVSSYGMYDLRTINKTVKAVVTVEFGLK